MNKLEEELKAQNEFEADSEETVEAAPVSGKEKLRRASMFAMGAAKTGIEKFKEGIDDIVNKDMVTKGEETYAKTKVTVTEAKDKVTAFAKTTTDNIKNKFAKSGEGEAAENAEESAPAEDAAPAEEAAPAEPSDTSETLS